MGNVFDYLDWRGDLTFHQYPFCEADSLVLSCLSYVELEGIVSMDRGCVTVKEAADSFFASHTKEEIEGCRAFLRQPPYLLQKMAATARFRDARILHYINIVEPGFRTQFSAMEIHLPDSTSFIAFRGTDDTLTGWHEDFNMCLGPVPSEQYALEYLNSVAATSSLPLRLGGHSKGGHLAIYGAAKASSEIQSRILQIYDHDGPGFLASVANDPGFCAIQSRILRFAPEFTLLGGLMNHVSSPSIVQSTNRRIMQHDCFTWQILGAGFLPGRRLHPYAALLHQAMNQWISETAPTKRQHFIDNIFEILYSCGLETLSEFQDEGLRLLPRMAKQLERLTPENRKMTERFLRLLIRHSNR